MCYNDVKSYDIQIFLFYLNWWYEKYTIILTDIHPLHEQLLADSVKMSYGWAKKKKKQSKQSTQPLLYKLNWSTAF